MRRSTNNWLKSSLSFRKEGFQEIWTINEKNPKLRAALVALLLKMHKMEELSRIHNSEFSESYRTCYLPKGCPILVTSGVASFENLALTGRGYATQFADMAILRLSATNYRTTNIENNQNPHFVQIPINDPGLHCWATNVDLFILSPHEVDDVITTANILRQSKLIIICNEENRKPNQQFQILEDYEEFLTPEDEITHEIEIDTENLRSNRINYLKQIIKQLHSFTNNNNNYSNLKITMKIISNSLETTIFSDYYFYLARIMKAIRILQENPALNFESFTSKVLDPHQQEEGENSNESVDNYLAAAQI